MTLSNLASEISELATLLREYSFDGATTSLECVVEQWLQVFEPIWISHAITESLYQGRYKVVSVEQILNLWQRRGHPIRHFNREFESIILGQSYQFSISLESTSSTSMIEPNLLSQGGEGNLSAVELLSHGLIPDSAVSDGDDDSGILNGSAVPIDSSSDTTVAPEPAASKPITPSLVLIASHLEQLEQLKHLDPPACPQPGVLSRSDLEAADSTIDRSQNWVDPEPVGHLLDSPPAGETTQPEPIKPFVPQLDRASIMHRRLRAVVRGNSEVPGD